jgi:hypothetical protein
MSQTAQTWALVAATLGAVVITFIGTSYQQRRQAKHDAKIRREQAAGEARIRLEQNAAELLAAAQDLMTGVRAIGQAHERRTKPRHYLRLAAMLMRDYPVPETWSDLADLSRLRPLLGTALEADRYQLDEVRTIAVDLAAIVATKASRYLAVTALITLGEDREIADAVRKLTPKVIGLMERIAARKRERERLLSDLQKAMEDFRDLADKRLGNVNHPPGTATTAQEIDLARIFRDSYQPEALLSSKAPKPARISWRPN